mmetsp:Transcript_29584/g.28313  ORF Transcript_29584/g.28313 Transcript_29584/m.28313 type:complete len:83 (-) Transcript_29584:46-294(-)
MIQIIRNDGIGYNKCEHSSDSLRMNDGDDDNDCSYANKVMEFMENPDNNIESGSQPVIYRRYWSSQLMWMLRVLKIEFVRCR